MKKYYFLTFNRQDGYRVIELNCDLSMGMTVDLMESITDFLMGAFRDETAAWKAAAKHAEIIIGIGVK